jgi:hypothetical protein
MKNSIVELTTMRDRQEKGEREGDQQGRAFLQVRLDCWTEGLGHEGTEIELLEV